VEVPAVVARASAALAQDARRPEVSAVVDQVELERAFEWVLADLYVALDGGAVRGHLVANLIDDPLTGRGAWVGPDGVSFDDPEVLWALYAVAGESWIAAGAREHYVWTLDDALRQGPWLDLAFARVHHRGVRRLRGDSPPLPTGYRLRRGGPGDLEAVAALSNSIDLAQRAGPSFALVEPGDERASLAETLGDPDVAAYLLERADEVVGQVLALELGPRRGTHPRTTHLSAVAVADGLRGQGLGAAMVDAVLGRLARAGAEWAEVNWRSAHRDAARFWGRRGFAPTYVRLHRTIGPI
jgi:GNAT superfamily N-acetyltransferase